MEKKNSFFKSPDLTREEIDSIIVQDPIQQTLAIEGLSGVNTQDLSDTYTEMIHSLDASLEKVN
jgi:hypothetical protein